MQNTYNLAATCSAGTEDLVAGEIQSFGGAEIRADRGVVTWRGDLESAYRACLWSRFASRVLLEVAVFPATDEDSLYDGAGKVDWSEHLDVDATFAVDCTVASDAPSLHSRYAALRVKDAVVDQFRDRFGRRPSVATNRPSVRLNLLVRRDQALLAVDLSGDSLHRRGYRVEGGKAPLKESLAAAIVANTGWRRSETPEPLVDPMCGSGTLLIEAALMYGDSAPGLSRTYFGFMGWKHHEPKLWDTLVGEALTREEEGSGGDWPAIVGYDSDPQAVKAARENIRHAGLDDRITVGKAELASLQAPAAHGLLLSNLPYGERLLGREEASMLYRALGRIARTRFDRWRLAVLIASPELTDSFGLSWQQKISLYNGPLSCRLLVTTIHGQQTPRFTWRLADPSTMEEGQDFANRLRKNLKKAVPRAEREDISCFRVYDRDLPDYNVSIDLFEKWVLVQEYAPPASVDSDLAAVRFRTVLKVVRETLGVRADRVFIKTRQRQRGKKQYEKSASRKKMLEVREGDCFYLVNFTDYLDTGLFLDHRPTRLRIHAEATGKRFLNLFGYTGTATIQAAAGGAASTTTVDLSQTYLSWTRKNLALNGFDTVNNRIECADCLQWLQGNPGRFDLIFVDPPTFSNTKKQGRVFDLQRDHLRLLTLAMDCLAPEGLLLFSTNFRKFRLDKQLGELFLVNDISRESIPWDFSRNHTVHRCWEMRGKRRD